MQLDLNRFYASQHDRHLDQMYSLDNQFCSEIPIALSKAAIAYPEQLFQKLENFYCAQNTAASLSCQ